MRKMLLATAALAVALAASAQEPKFDFSRPSCGANVPIRPGSGSWNTPIR